MSNLESVAATPPASRQKSLPARTGRDGAPHTAVIVRNAVLEYPLPHAAQGSIKESVLGVFGARAPRTTMPRAVRALDDVTFSIAHGERVGVIGRNGAGKSSTLRALAGIYPLKSGLIEVQGDIGTLLDFTHGFEKEATGRENIKYRGLAMGLSPRLIKEYEQKIVEFADLGGFIDLPVRTYSAGMYVRLGFAISTQFAPDILLIDEVFGAGDAAFTERATARMHEMLDNSGLLIMVTHSLGLVRQLCTRVIWLERGKIVMDAPTDDVLAAYRLEMSDQSQKS